MKSKKSILFWSVFSLLLFAAVLAGIFFFKTGREKKEGFSFENMPEAEMQFSISEEMTVANGVTGVGVTEEIFEVENLSTELEIEEVYISAEDVIEKGNRVLKLSETSIAEARAELEKVKREAELAYRAGKIEYEQSKITLKYEMDSKVLSGEQAKEVYEETLAGLKDSVDRAEKELQDAEEEIAEYQSYVSDNSYESYFKVDEYQTAYDETLDALKKRMDDWGVSWSQVTTGGGGMNADRGSSGSGASGGTGEMPSGNLTPDRTVTVSGNDVHDDNAADVDIPDNNTPQNKGPGSDQIQVLASLYKILEKQGEKLEQAKDEYEEAVVNAAFEMQTLELQIPELKQKLTEAEKSYGTEAL